MGRLDLRDVLPLARHALDRGATVPKPGNVRWDVSGRCEAPRAIERHASARSASDVLDYLVGKQVMSPVTVLMETRCRKCAACLRFRARSWANRAQAEINAASRTWFATLTLRPEAHYTMLLRAKHRLAEKGVTFEALSVDEQFAERHASVSEEITLWVKRLRKQSGATLRVLLVAEAHKSGLPHYHGLIHEVSPDDVVKHALLSDSWRLGFTKFKLVPPDDGVRRTAWYVCKYLTKDNRARVRASVGYGSSHELHRETDEKAPALAIALKGSREEKAPPKGEDSSSSDSGCAAWNHTVGDPRGD